MDIAINLMLAIFSAYIVFEFYSAFFEVSKNKTKIKLIILAYVVWQIISMPSISDIHQLIRLVLSMLFVAIIGACFVGSVIGRIVFAIIYNALWMLIEVFTGAIFLNIGVSVEKFNLLGSFLCQLILFILIKLLSWFFRNSNVKQFPLKYNGVLMIIPLGCMFSSYHSFVLSAETGSKFDLWISIVVFIVNLAVMSFMFVMYVKLGDRYELKRKNDIYSLNLELYSENLKEKEATMTEFMKSKHDLNHKLLYLMDITKNNENDKAVKYIEELINMKPLNSLMIANTNNSSLDALINAKYVSAVNQGIEFNVKLNIPYGLPFNSSDLCILLGNAIDNSIEANLKNGVISPYINLNITYDMGNLVIILENSFNGVIHCDKDGNIISTKPDKANHGFGIKSIKDLVLKYDGDIDIDIAEKTYKLSIILYSGKEKYILTNAR